ncbi:MULTISPECIES: GNAT family N-acetyltransferase [unclassified Streptomyces]|jgi:GNAT superfamily N-acetyltransferase|uniref:GNAT family N-acetyltransferase n=1 Tax=Streptomyces sp. NPDC005955 TaxID=3364738 RepID=UPI0036B783FE
MIDMRVASSADYDRIDALDDSFTTDRILHVTGGDSGFEIRSVAVQPPLRKEYPADPEADLARRDQDAHHTVVAVEDDRIVGFVTVSYAEWNQRAHVEQVTVDPAYRGKGLGSALMARAESYGRKAGARTLWLEVTHVNAPAVRAYRRLGFEVCGLDTSLYVGTPAEGEIALFMSKSLD